MANEHLSDQQLQEYLDGVLAPELVTIIEGHLRHCHLCQAELRQYRTLFTELKDEPPVGLAPEFPDRVMSAIRRENMKALLARLWTVIWPLGCVAAALVVMSRYINFQSIASAFTDSLNPTRYFDSTFLTSLTLILERFNIKPNLIMFAGLTLIVVFLIDQFISKYRSKIFSHLKIILVF